MSDTTQQQIDALLGKRQKIKDRWDNRRSGISSIADFHKELTALDAKVRKLRRAWAKARLERKGGVMLGREFLDKATAHLECLRGTITKVGRTRADVEFDCPDGEWDLPLTHLVPPSAANTCLPGQMVLFDTEEADA